MVGLRYHVNVCPSYAGGVVLSELPGILNGNLAPGHVLDREQLDHTPFVLVQIESTAHWLDYRV